MDEISTDGKADAFFSVLCGHSVATKRAYVAFRLCGKASWRR
jgi:hypothetical protein